MANLHLMKNQFSKSGQSFPDRQQTATTEESEKIEKAALLGSLFDSTFEQSSLAKALIDAGGNLIRVNQKLIELTGCSFEKLSRDYFNAMIGSEQDQHQNQVSRLLKVDANHTAEKEFVTFLRPDGKDAYFVVSLTRVLDQDGELSFYIKSIEDITTLRNNEIQIRRMAQEFDNFVYRAFHDLQGPLSTIEGVCNIMKLSRENLKTGQFANMIEGVALKMKKALIGMLEAAKINDLEMKKVVVNFEDLVSNLLADFEKMPEFKDIKFQYFIQAGLLYTADPTYLNIIIKHLLENAILFRNVQEEALINLQISQDAQQRVCIRISDNGIGISDEDQEVVFQMFCRKSTRSQGAGLGLYLVKQSVERLGGDIQLRSQIGKGTVVEVFL